MSSAKKSSGTKSSATLTLAVLTLVAGVGCAHANTQGPSVATAELNSDASSRQQKDQLKATPTPAAADATADDQQGMKDLQAALESLKNTRVFFTTDDDSLTPQGREKLTTIGDILSKHRNLKIRVEGNCDERGTEAYNLVLGQRRADAARAYLVNFGAKDDQVATISYGLEHPVANGHNEQAWSQNRRDDVVILNGAN